jgi:hypothetical protein
VLSQVLLEAHLLLVLHQQAHTFMFGDVVLAVLVGTLPHITLVLVVVVVLGL